LSWSRLTPGAQTTIDPPSTYASGNGGMFSEEWLVDNQSYACTSNVGHACWIEAGFRVDPGLCNANPIFTWEDIVPYGNQVYQHNFCGYAWPHDSWTLVTVAQQPADATKWDIRFNNDPFNVHFSDLSYNNGMNPNRIDIGSELYGTSGAQSGQVSWANSAYGGANQSFYLQFSDGHAMTGVLTNPPYGGWVTRPSQSAGGYYYTTCC